MLSYQYFLIESEKEMKMKQKSEVKNKPRFYGQKKKKKKDLGDIWKDEKLYRKNVWGM